MFSLSIFHYSVFQIIGILHPLLHPLICSWFPIVCFSFHLLYYSSLIGSFYIFCLFIEGLPEFLHSLKCVEDLYNCYFELYKVDCLTLSCLNLLSEDLLCSFVSSIFLCFLILFDFLCFFLWVRQKGYLSQFEVVALYSDDPWVDCDCVCLAVWLAGWRHS